MAENAKPQEETKDDLAEVVKAVIDSSDLQNYFHADKSPERKPLYILLNEQINSDLKLNKFGENVVFADCDEIKKSKKAYLEFTKIDRQEDSANVVFRYRAEGIEGKVSLKKSDGGWSVTGQQISEVKFEDKGCSAE